MGQLRWPSLFMRWKCACFIIFYLHSLNFWRGWE
jgi:hypothetical protein